MSSTSSSRASSIRSFSTDSSSDESGRNFNPSGLRYDKYKISIPGGGKMSEAQRLNAVAALTAMLNESSGARSPEKLCKFKFSQSKSDSKSESKEIFRKTDNRLEWINRSPSWY